MTPVEKRVIEAARKLCEDWQEEERRWLHVSVFGTDIYELREAVKALEPEQLDLGL